MKKRRGILILSGLLLVLSACDRGEKPFNPSEFKINIPSYFPTQLNIPADNPMTVEGVNLGRYLFYDGRLSGRTDADSLMTCATCHLQSRSFESGMDNKYYADGKMKGLRGTTTYHSMLPLINLVFQNKEYTWNGAVSSDRGANLESIVQGVLTDTNELAGNLEDIRSTIASIPMYPPMFEAAFGSAEVTIDHICKAIAQFVRTLVSADSKFDRYLREKNTNILTEEEWKGYILFITEEGADCFHCHGGAGNPLFSTYEVVNNGLDPESEFNDPFDRSSVTGNPMHKGWYRIPTLRNLAYTAPYMHDGRYTTIDEVIDQYSEGVHYSSTISPLMHHVKDGGVQLTDIEKRQLKAFLNTLNDTLFVTNPLFSKPDDNRLP